MTRHLALILAPLLALPVLAQSNSIQRHDSSAPIDFSADRIEVREAASQAVISGNVQVDQGSLDLTAAEVRVFYRSGSDDLTVDRLDATGGVVITTPAERAQAAAAYYDVPNSLVTLVGNVLLTRNGDIVRGERLVIDLNDGQSVIDGAGSRTAGRVTGSFTPRSAQP
ncbi:MAG: LptA/OstA family protein [Pacificimonas sp.]